MKAVAADTRHALLPISSVGRRTEYSGFSSLLVFKYTKYPNAARERLVHPNVVRITLDA